MPELTITLPDELASALAELAAGQCRTPEGQVTWLIRQAVLGRQAALERERALALRTARMKWRARSSTELMAELQRAYAEAGKPSTRELSRRVADGGHRLSHTSCHDILSGNRAPTWHVLEQIMIALGGDVEAARKLWLEANT